jgi:hypothetical protein
MFLVVEVGVFLSSLEVGRVAEMLSDADRRFLTREKDLARSLDVEPHLG